MRRFLVSLALAAVLSVGLSAFVPKAFGCGTAGPGSCVSEPGASAPATDESGVASVIAWIRSFFA